jgi:uncharacterized protein involved in exopolysaccharide biosynthesis
MDSLTRIEQREPPAPYDADPGRRPPAAARDVLAAVFRRRTRMILIFFAVLALVAAATFLRPRMYETRARILVKYTSEYVYRPEVGEARLPIALAPEEILNSEVSILTSDELIREVIDEIGVSTLYPGSFRRGPPSVDEATRSFRKNLSVEGIRRSTVLQVSFRHPDPQLSARALHALVERFEKKHVTVFSEGTFAFLEDQLRTYADRLKRSDEKLEAFRQEHGVFEYAEQMTLLLRERASLDATQRQARVELAEAQRRLEPLRAALEGPRPADVMVAIQTDMIRLEGEAQARRARLQAVSAAVEDLDERIRELERYERELASIRRDIAQDEKNYEAYRARVEEMRVATALGEQSISNISVIDPGSVPAQPAGSRRAVMLAVGVFLAGLSAVIYAFIAEYLSQGMATPESVQKRLGVPVLASVGRLR